MVMTPWTLKALIGMVSDTIPIFGYYKRGYVVLATLIGCGGCAVLANARSVLPRTPLPN
jgi:hypothetical protein